MSKVFSLALLGLLPNDESKIKILLNQMIPNKIQWTSATASSLDGVIINAHFINTPQIQKYVNNVSAHVVFCCSSIQTAKEVRQKGFACLNTSGFNEADLKAWIQVLLTGSGDQAIKQEESASPQKPSVSPAQETQMPVGSGPDMARIAARPESAVNPNPLKEKTITNVSTGLSTEDITAKTEANPHTEGIVARVRASSGMTRTREEIRAKASADANSIIDESESSESGTTLAQIGKVLSVIQARSDNLIATYDKQTTWIDTRNGEVVINYNREDIAPIESLHWERLPEFNPPDNLRKLQLELWLFAVLWQSRLDYNMHVSKASAYKLNRWPQPLNRNGRNEILRIAATIQLDCLNIDQIMERTGYPRSIIAKFLFATNYLGQTSTVKNYTQNYTYVEAEDDEVKKSLIQRLRIKLGI